MSDAHNNFRQTPIHMVPQCIHLMANELRYMFEPGVLTTL
jgi:hypothetical protein